MKRFTAIAKRFALAGLAASLLLGGVFGINAHAQLPASDPLYQTISGLDSALFDAYNHCDLAKMGSMVADDLEFYHDQTGLSVGKQSLLDAVKNNICGKVQRELVAGSLEVYPLKGYGAVEIGVHRFTHPNDPQNVGDAKFVQLWQLKDGSWKVTRVISFDHNAPPHQPSPSK
jgi:hypothetical protein